MKKGIIIAVLSFVALSALLYLMPITPTSEPAPDVDEAVQSVSSNEKSDLDKKVEEAIEIIQNSEGAPMQGITMLREVLEKDPDNLKANYWMGEFSVMSGQLDKAVLRYEKVLEVDPSNYEVALKLYDVFLQLGDSEKGKKVLSSFLINNPEGPGRTEIENVLNKIN